MFENNKIGDTSNPKYIIAKTVDDCLDVSDFLKNKTGTERGRSNGKYIFAVTSVNRNKYESEPVIVVSR
jgi:hypothetical protein